MNDKKKYEEDELIARLKGKDLVAFSYLYDQYAPALYSLILQIVKDEEIGKDVLQEVFLKIWSKLEGYDSAKGRLFTWFINVSRNAAIDQTRSKHYRQAHQQKFLSEDENGYSSFNLRLDDLGLKKAVNLLNEDYRMLINLNFYQGFTQEQIAKALNIPLGTVKSRIRTALLLLRKLLVRESEY